MTGYSPEVEYALDVYSDDPVIGVIRAVTDGELTGDSARVEIMTADLFDTDGSGSCAASKRDFTVVPDKCGEGTDALIYTGTLRALGDPVFGRYDPDTGVFSE